MMNIKMNRDMRILFGVFLLLIFAVILAFSIKFNEAFVVPKRFFLRSITAILLTLWTYLLLKYPSKEPQTPAKADFFETALCFLRRYTERIPRSVIVGLAFLYLIVVFISVVFSRNQWASFDYFFDKVCFLFIFTMIISTFQFNEMKKTLIFLLMLGLMVGTYSIIQHLGIDPVAWSQYDLVKNRSISTLGNPDFLSAILVMIIPLAFCYAFREGAKDKGIAALLIWGFLCGVNIWTYSRAGLAAMLVGTAAAGFFLGWSRLKKHWKKTLAVAIILLLAFSIIIIAEASGLTRLSLVERITSAISAKDINVLTRVYLWKAGLYSIRDNPLTGTGPSTFSIAYLPFRYLEPVNIRRRIAMPESSHNLFIDIGVFSGIFALIAFIGMLLAVFISGFKSLYGKKSEIQSHENSPESAKEKKKDKDSDESIPEDNRLYLAAFLAGITAFLTHHLASFPTYPDELLFWIFLAFCALLTGTVHPFPEKPPEKFLPLWKIVVIAACSILSFVLIYKSTQIAIAEFYFTKADAFKTAMFETGDPKAAKYYFQKALKNYDESIKINGMKPEYWLNKGRLLEKYSYINTDQNLNLQLFEMAIKNYDMAIRLNPENPYPHADLARYCARWNLKEAAEIALKEYKEALRLDKYNIPIMTDLALLYIRQKKYKEAEELFTRIVEIYPPGFMEQGNLGILYLETGKEELAKKQMEILYELLPDGFSVEDIRNLGNTFNILKERKRPEDKRIFGLLSKETQNTIDSWYMEKLVSAKEINTFVQDLNTIVSDRNLYNKNDFPGITLDGKSQELYDKGLNNLSENEIKKFNMILLSLVYPDDLSTALNFYRKCMDQMNKFKEKEKSKSHIK